MPRGGMARTDNKPSYLNGLDQSRDGALYHYFVSIQPAFSTWSLAPMSFAHATHGVCSIAVSFHAAPSPGIIFGRTQKEHDAVFRGRIVSLWQAGPLPLLY